MSDQADAGNSILPFDLAALIGASDEAALKARIAQALGDGKSDLDHLPLDDLIARIARREGVVRSPGATLTTGGALQIAAMLDDRVRLMLEIWSKLGHRSTPPPNHRQFLERLHEDERFVGTKAPEPLEEIVLATIAACDSSIVEDDLDELLDGSQPTHFCYEVLKAHSELPDDALSRDDGEGFGETADTDDDDEEPDSFEPIDAQVTAYNVDLLFRFVEDGQLELNPPWQRTEVWSRGKQRELIKSLLLGIPLPSIILHKKGSEYAIIDGKQRLTSIHNFMKNAFKLPNMKLGHSLNEHRGAWFDKEGKKSLPSSVRNQLKARQIPVLEFRNVPEQTLRRIFHLYNVSGTRLNAAEIRNAVYQTNPIHRVAYILAGEKQPPADLHTGNFEEQQRFTDALEAVLPSRKRYAAVDFLCRYLGYSRAAHDPKLQFTLASTSVSINRYFDHVSASENPILVAQEIIQVFRAAEEIFDIDDERLPFHRRDEETGDRKFNALVAISNLIAARFLLAAMEAELVTREEVDKAVREVLVEYPENQQRATIWDYQAKLLLGLRDALSLNYTELESGWARFFDKMEFARIPDDEIAT